MKKQSKSIALASKVIFSAFEILKEKKGSKWMKWIFCFQIRL